MDLGLIISLIVLGLVSGLAAGLLGIGGGGIMVPLLTIVFSAQGFADYYTVHMAIATSLGVILFTSMSSVYAHHRRGAILWPAAFMLIPGIVVGSWLGPMIAAWMNAGLLAGLFGAFAVFTAFKMLRGKSKKAAGPREAGQKPVTQRPVEMPVAGLGIGIFSGLVGVGGGSVTVPLLEWRGTPIHNAIATSAVMGFPIALFGAASNIYQGWGLADLPAGSLGFIHVPALLSVAVASVLSAPLGARLSHALDVKYLKRIFGIFMLVLAVYMFWKAFVG